MAAASPLADVDPRAAGLDPDRLARITEHLRTRYIEPGKIAGCQTVVARGGHVAYASTLGERDRERGLPVVDDTVWRIFSMTKPITGVALMALYEHGHFQLTDPVHRFIPEWRDLRVTVKADDGSRRLVEPDRPMNIRDLLMHMSGLGYTLSNEDLVLEQGRFNTVLEADQTLADMCSALAQQPLRFHPGTRWLYSLSTDVCARLVEVMSGRRFDEYLQDTLFGPLGMRDTGFRVGDDAVDRFAAAYWRHPVRKELRLADDPVNSGYRKTRAFLSGGGGLVSTAGDYLRFAQMLSNGGELDGVRILGRKTVELMTTNHLPGGGSLPQFALPGGYGEVGFDGMGFGLSMAVSRGPAETGVIGSRGEFMWGGAASTIFWVDPVEDLTVVFMTQVLPSGTFNFRGQLKSLVYPAILD